MSENNNNNTNTTSNEKCAPGQIFEDGSCISLNILINMAEAHNAEMADRKLSDKTIKLYPSLETLNRSKYKRYLLSQFEKLYEGCDDQICWTKQDFVKRMGQLQQEELTKFTFRPKGPKGKFEWLNTLNINDVMRQYEDKYPEFKYLGTVPMDFDDIPSLGIKDLDYKKLIAEGKTKLGIIFNLDESWKSGSHWVAGYADLKNGQVYYFDSYGIQPEPRVRKFMRRVARFCEEELKIKPVADHNKIRHQYEGSECGVYSINFILRMLRGDSFESICKSKVPDKKINQCRIVYFNKVEKK